MTVTPSQPTVSIGGTTQLKAVANFSDGSSRDVTGQVAWRSSDPRSIAINTAGGLSGLATGTAIISGAYQGHAVSVQATSDLGELVWSGPLVITRGGTYSGNWQNTDGHSAAILIKTQAPVIIENSRLRSNADLIRVGISGANLTIRNSAGVAMAPTGQDQGNGRFVEVTSPVYLDVENNYMENVSVGVVIHGFSGNRGGLPTIVVRANRARDINGTAGNAGGESRSKASALAAHFIELDDVQSVPGVVLGWNEIVNRPGRSLVGDNIAIFRSSGTANQPIEIHDSYIEGASPQGGGITLQGSVDDTVGNASAFNNLHDNQVVRTGSRGISFFAGHNNVATHNRVISSGMVQAGQENVELSIGMANEDETGVSIAHGAMYNNLMRDNTIGWMCWESSCAAQGHRMDARFSAAPEDYSSNSVLVSQPITPAMEEQEYQRWWNKLDAAGVSIGPTFQY
jgi:hypothetical protein